MKFTKILLLIICVLTLLSSLQNIKVEALTFTITKTFTSLSYDGEIWREGDYDLGNWAETGTVRDTSPEIRCGVNYTGNYIWQIFRSFLFFDTSSIADNAVIQQAILSIYVKNDYSTVDFNVTVQSGLPIYPHCPLQPNDYYREHYGTTNGGSKNTSLISGTGYWNITLNADGRSWIKKDGLTKLCLRSLRDMYLEFSYEKEYIVFYAMEQGITYAPKLYVTYQYEGCRYNIYGPYNEDGVRCGSIIVTVYPKYSAPFNFTLNGNYTLELENRPLMLTYKVSESLNLTRYFWIKNDIENIFIFKPDTAKESVYNYAFVINDFAGLGSGCWLESLVCVNGTDYVCERQPADLVNAVVFTMVFGRYYNIRLVNAGNSLTWSFQAKAEGTINLIVPPLAFPPESFQYGDKIKAFACRKNATWIQINYTDTSQSTIWVHIQITLYNNPESVIYWQNQTGNNQMVNFYNAAPNKSYIVKLTFKFSTENTSITHSWVLLAPQQKINPWDFNFFGHFPIQSNQILALLVLVFFAGACSVANKEAGIIIVWLIACLLQYVGFLDVGWTILSIVGSLAILWSISKARKRRTL